MIQTVPRAGHGGQGHNDTKIWQTEISLRREHLSRDRNSG